MNTEPERDYRYENLCWRVAVGFLVAALLLSWLSWFVTARQLTHAMILLEHKQR